jgi:hypothetical protein
MVGRACDAMVVAGEAAVWLLLATAATAALAWERKHRTAAFALICGSQTT